VRSDFLMVGYLNNPEATTRQAIRTLKRAIHASIGGQASDDDRLRARESAVALNARSIRFGHKRLALLRLAIAVDVGAQIPSEHWAYCFRVAQGSRDLRNQELYRSTAFKAMKAKAYPTEDTDFCRNLALT
jgi:hypothetical protein